MPSKSQSLRPRLCALEKGDNGYGFHLHGEKGKTGQFIRLVEPDSPAEASGLLAGDRLVFVNGDDVENESHQQVVSRIRAASGRLELVVVDPDTESLLRKHNVKCLKEYVEDGLPFMLRYEEGDAEEERPREEEEVDGTDDGEERPDVEVQAEERAGGSGHSTPVPDSNGGIHGDAERKLSVNSHKEPSPERRPRLCVIRREAGGYGFNLHSERARPGQYIRAVDEDSPAEKAGLQPKDRIVQVNGVLVEAKTHSEVVAAIKAGGDETRLLVVDPETDAFFKRCRVTPTTAHLSGALPEPDVNGGMEDKVNGGGAERDSKPSVSPSPSNASSNASITSPSSSTPPEGVAPGAIPALTMSLQQVKELAHQKRSNKRAPPMDWTKKNELFSNL
ncbi:Na(+)/H(+) exchange regulatory cofactor NHE-RF1 isoform X2 [Nerophis ophidion]|uniref:Na(+)/H(+) exchange regulatory cofactor NHE-RF1 isoform X2 n=1 Tax=Nerophis ophidion TaxID=159077 RepID=UPI002ADFA004|nr:Na(+)/H(+) exchange regulatory cofactor NHE-RF1 isoform X2 [Nerophis ophidion]